MPPVNSTQSKLGSTAPSFTLLDTISGEQKSLEDLRGEKATLVMFICNHCPFVKHVNAELVSLANDYQDKGVGFIGISSNDAVTYPDDGPEKMAEIGREVGYPFPYLFDETQEVARAYDAACTPDFFLFDGDLKCVYAGQLDDSRPKTDIPVTGADLRAALDAVLSGEAPAADQTPSIGCSVKWKE